MNNIKNIALSVLCIVIGISLCYIFTKNSSKQTPVVTKQMITTLEKEAEQSEIYFIRKLDTLNKQRLMMDREIGTLKERLSQSKKKSASVQSQVQRLVNNKPATTGSSDLFKDCDSLMEQVSLLMETTAEKDSLYDSVIIHQQYLLNNKDTAISLQHQQYSDLKNSFTKSIEQQKSLLDQNKQLQTQVRKQKIKSKIISGLTAIAAGIAANYLLNH